MSIDYAQLEALARDLDGAPQRIQNRVNGRLTRGMRELLSIARGLTHVQTGRLRDSLYILQPSVVGDLTESSIASLAPYAGAEAERGGEHDFPAQTIEEGQAAIDAIARDIEDIFVAELGAGRG